MNILCTGSEGFIGKHVCKKLRALGHDVVGVDNLEPRVHGDEIGTVFPPLGIDFHRVSYDSIPYHVLREANVVIHLAAQVGV
ncbi:hypothetical protein LCGC14_1909890, partial [marine sediment metagenome]